MKLQLLSFLFLAIFGYFLFSSSSQGRAASANMGNTGAPGDDPRTCVNCHNSGNIQVDLKIDVLDLSGNVVSDYAPGEQYQVRVRVNDIGNIPPRGHGFQMICLDAPLDVNGSDIKNWIDNTSNNYKISNARGRQYVEHDGPSMNNEFVVDWTAPVTSSGQVSFYAAGNGVNLNGITTGDGADVDKLELPERVSTSVSEVTLISSVSPIPATDQINIRFGQSFSGTLTLTDLAGRTGVQERLSDETQWTLNLDRSTLKNGIYILTLRDGKGQSDHRRIILK